MALIGLGVGPTLSGLQITMQRTVAPAAIGAAMGPLLLRQVGASLALAAAEMIYASGLDGGRTDAAATATGTSVFAVALVGAALAVVALFTLPRASTRLALAPARAMAQAVPA
jgi:hypothetical protein